MYLYPTGPQYNGGYPSASLGSQIPWCCNPDFICPLYRQNFQRSDFTSSGITDSELELSNKIRELWEQHTAWTRATIVSLVFSLPDVDFVTNRLLKY
ncbi:MAG: hypothetical protein ABRQ25_14030 [Clostridiaceae bacterium]